MKRLALIALLLTLTACPTPNPNPQPTTCNPPFPARIAGYSGYGAFSIPYDSTPFVKTLADNGINFMREWATPLPLSWGGEQPYAWAAGKPTLNEKFFTSADKLAEAACAKGIHLMVDLVDHYGLQDRMFGESPLNVKHGGPLTRGLPDVYEHPTIKEMAAFTVKRLAKHKNVHYQLMNEPGGCISVKQCKDFHNALAAIVRANHPGAKIFLNPVSDRLGDFTGIDADVVVIHGAGVREPSSAASCSVGEITETLTEAANIFGKPVLPDDDGLWNKSYPCNRDNMRVLRDMVSASQYFAGYNHKGAEPPETPSIEAMQIVGGQGQQTTGGMHSELYQILGGHTLDVDNGSIVLDGKQLSAYTPSRWNNPTLGVKGGDVFAAWGDVKSVWVSKNGGSKQRICDGYTVEQIGLVGNVLMVFATAPQPGLYWFSADNGTKLAGPVIGGGKEISTGGGAWMTYFGNNAFISRAPGQLEKIPGAGWIQGTPEVFAWPEFSEKQFPGDITKTAKTCSYYATIKKTRCWYISGIKYQEAGKTSQVMTFRTPTDAEVQNYRWPTSGRLGVATGVVAYDQDDVIIVAKLNGSAWIGKIIGNGRAPSIVDGKLYGVGIKSQPY